MKGLRASTLVETSGLLASAVLTFEVDGKPVDMVKALGSMEQWDDLSAAIQSGCKLLSDVPDVVIGLPGVDHVDLSTEKLDALHKELQTNKQLFTRTTEAVSRCLFAIAEVIRVHPKTCGVPKGQQDTILAWVAGFQQRAQEVEPSGSGSRYFPYAPTSATRIQDLKFFLTEHYRFFGTDAARLNHVTVPTLQPCNPEAVLAGTWEETKTCLDRQSLCPQQEGWVRAEAVPWDVYKEKMGYLYTEAKKAPVDGEKGAEKDQERVDEEPEQMEKRVAEFRKILEDYSAEAFCVGGQVPLRKKFSKIVCWPAVAEVAAKSPATEGRSSPLVINLLECTEKVLAGLQSAGSPSPFGRGSEKVFDERVRKAVEFPAERMASQFVPVFNAEFCSRIQRLLGGRSFFLQPHKLNVYGEGAHFAKHKDTIRDPRMVASVVVCCPTSFEGGVLSLVDNRGIQIDFDWSQSALAPENNPDRGSADAGGTDQVMNWACFFCDVDHEVSPVTKGTRLTLTYDVCIESTDSERGDSKRGGGVKAEVEERSGESSGESSDESSDESFGDQKFEVEQKPEVEQGKWNEIAVQIASKVESRNEEQLLILLDKLNGAHRYGYYPAHDYAFGATDTWTGEKDWESQLKGVDLQVYRALTKREWVAKLLVLYADLDLYGPAVHFNVGHSPDDPVSMEDAIDFEELETLRSITELRMINIPQRDPSTIYRYSFWYGYTGNEPIEKRDSYYARTVLVFSKSPITNDKNHTAL